MISVHKVITIGGKIDAPDYRNQDTYLHIIPEFLDWSVFKRKLQFCTSILNWNALSGKILFDVFTIWINYLWPSDRGRMS